VGKNSLFVSERKVSFLAKEREKKIRFLSTGGLLRRKRSRKVLSYFVPFLNKD